MTSALKIKESGSSGRRYTADGVQISGRQSVYDQDEIGNRITSNTPGYVPYTVNDDNQYTVMRDVSLTYDPAGNLLTNGSTSYSWDNENRLTQVASTSKLIQFTYDTQGRRIEKKVWNNTTGTGTPATYLKYIYDGMNLAADYDAYNYRITRTYTYGPGVDNIQSMTIYDQNGDPKETYYYIKDASNTVHVLVDEDGLIVEYYYYDAFGNLMKMRDVNYNLITESVYGNRFLFQGREYDYDTALYYFRARWYEPETGRWLSPDPIGISGGLNLYAFCGNDPVNFVDPMGYATIRIYTNNGIIVLIDPSISDFRSKILEQPDFSIKCLEIIGHGAWNMMSVQSGDSTDGLYWIPDSVVRGVVFSDTSENFADCVRDKFSPDGVINLKGCNTGIVKWFSNKENIAKQLSREIPGIKVIGSRGYVIGNEISYPFDRSKHFRIGKEDHTLIRFYRSYRNGNPI